MLVHPSIVTHAERVLTSRVQYLNPLDWAPPRRLLTANASASPVTSSPKAKTRNGVYVRGREKRPANHYQRGDAKEKRRSVLKVNPNSGSVAEGRPSCSERSRPGIIEHKDRALMPTPSLVSTSVNSRGVQNLSEDEKETLRSLLMKTLDTIGRTRGNKPNKASRLNRRGEEKRKEDGREKHDEIGRAHV